METSKKTKLVRRSFKLTAALIGATREVQEGMGVGVLATRVVTFNRTAADYDSPLFLMALIDEQNKLRDELLEIRVEAVDTKEA